MFSRKRGTDKAQALALSVGSLQPCDRSGWLLRQGKRFHAWDKRFFVLKAKSLYYFPSDDSTAASGLVVLDKTCVTRTEKDSGKQANIFSIEAVCVNKGKSGHRRLFLAAASPQEQQEWITAIDNACNAPDDPSSDSSKSLATEASATADPAVVTESVGTTTTTTITAVESIPPPSESEASGRQDAAVMTPTEMPRVDFAAKMVAAGKTVGFLNGGSQMEQFFSAWMKSMPSASELEPTKCMVFSAATSADMENITWRISGPQSLFAPKIVSFFWNMGSPMTEVDRLNDVGALINPRNIGSWIQTSLNGGMDGGWVFPAEIPFKLAVEGADSTEADDDAVTALSSWVDEHDVLVCTSLSRDMGKSPPQQTEFRMHLSGPDFNAQFTLAQNALQAFHFPPFPDAPVHILASASLTEPMLLSVVTCARGFVRVGLLVPNVPMPIVSNLLKSNGSEMDELNSFMAAAGCTAPKYVELQYLNKGYGYGVYKEGFNIVLHWEIGTEVR